MAKYQVITEQGDLGLGTIQLTDEERKALEKEKEQEAKKKQKK